MVKSSFVEAKKKEIKARRNEALKECKKCQHYDKKKDLCSQGHSIDDLGKAFVVNSKGSVVAKNRAEEHSQNCKYFVDKKEQLKKERLEIASQKKREKIALRKCQKCAFFDKVEQVCYSSHRFPSYNLDNDSYCKAIEENYRNAKLRDDAYDCKFAKKDNEIVLSRYDYHKPARVVFEENKSSMKSKLEDARRLRAEKEEKESRERLWKKQAEERAKREERERIEREEKEKNRLTTQFNKLMNGCPSTVEDFLDIINAYLRGCGANPNANKAIKWGIKGAKEFLTSAKRDLISYSKIMGRLEQIRKEEPELVSKLDGDVQNEWREEAKIADDLKNKLAEKAKNADNLARKEFYELNRFYKRNFNLEAEILVSQYWSYITAKKGWNEIEKVYLALKDCRSLKDKPFPGNIMVDVDVAIQDAEKRKSFEKMLKENISDFEKCLNIATRFMHGEGTYRDFDKGLKWVIKALELASNDMSKYGNALKALKKLRTEENTRLADSELLNKWDDVFKKAEEKKQALVRKSRNGDLRACRDARILNDIYDKSFEIEVELLVRQYWLELNNESGLNQGWNSQLDTIYNELEKKDRDEYYNKRVRGRLAPEIQSDWDRILYDAGPRKARSMERRKQVEAEKAEQKRIAEIKRNGKCKACRWFRHDVETHWIDKYGEVLDSPMVIEKDICRRCIPYSEVSPSGHCDEWEPIDSIHNHGYTNK